MKSKAVVLLSDGRVSGLTASERAAIIKGGIVTVPREGGASARVIRINGNYYWRVNTAENKQIFQAAQKNNRNYEQAKIKFRNYRSAYNAKIKPILIPKLIEIGFSKDQYMSVERYILSVFRDLST